MATLPQLIEEDVQQLETVLLELLEKSDATTALIIDKGGFLIAHQGDGRQFDLTTIAALASGARLEVVEARPAALGGRPSAPRA